LKRRLAYLAIAVALSVVAWRWMFPNDEGQIRAVLTRIADVVADAERAQRASQSLEGLARVAALQNEFAVEARVDAGPPFQRLQGRQSIVAAAARVLAATRDLELRFPEIAIEVSPDRQQATGMVTVEARFDEASGARGFDARELEIGFARLDGRWVIAEVTIVEAIERLDTR
jgi:hypothetical protein